MPGPPRCMQANILPYTCTLIPETICALDSLIYFTDILIIHARVDETRHPHPPSPPPHLSVAPFFTVSCNTVNKWTIIHTLGNCQFRETLPLDKVETDLDFNINSFILMFTFVKVSRRDSK